MHLVSLAYGREAHTLHSICDDSYGVLDESGPEEVFEDVMHFERRNGMAPGFFQLQTSPGSLRQDS